jgi:phenylacetate-CoA ligase
MKLVQYLPRFQLALRSLPAMAERETWPRSVIEAFQLERLNAVWKHAVSYVPYYRTLRTKADLPLRFSSLAEFRSTVPVLSKSEVRTSPQRFLSEQRRRGEWKRTGGSTGTPMNVYWASEAHLEMLRCKYRFYAMWGIDIFDRSAFLWGHSASFAPGLAGRVARFRQPLEDLLRNRIRLSAYDLGPNDLNTYLRKILRFRPVSVYGYSRGLYLLACKAAENGFRCDSLKLFTLSGEPAFPYIVEKIEQTFGAPAAVEYGSIECGFIAGEWPDRTLRVREDAVCVETLPREDGRYEIVVSVLNNRSFPLLRYALGDVTDAPLNCRDHGFAILQNVAGRNNDFIVTRSGRLLHSARFDALFKYHSKAIQGFQIRQNEKGALIVMLELNPRSAPADLERSILQRKIQELVEGYPVTLEIVASIPQTAAGKHRIVMSQLAATAFSECSRRCPGSPSKRTLN